jgi:hypothetical protein
VTEQGQEDAVLFERVFFVTEQTTPVDIGLDNVLVAGQSFAAIQPIVLFTPPADIQANIFDYNVCFVRNGRFDQSRCVDDPSLNQQPALRYYLDPRNAFSPEGADYFLDLSYLRVGPHIERTDLSQSPYRVQLEPDYARFAGSGLNPLLNGQPVIQDAVRDAGDPGVGAEYVLVDFSYVPPNDQRLNGEVLILGSFNGWNIDPAPKLSWVPERQRYEGAVLMKQGQYEYRYYLTDQQARRTLSNNLPRPDNLYTALVYYDDLRLNTDRILGVNAALSR